MRKGIRSGVGRHGFSLIEVMLSLVIFLGMTMVFAACFPMLARSGHYSATYTQAALIAQHKIDQLRVAGYSQVVTPSVLEGRGMIDPGGTTASMFFTKQENLASFFPAGTVGSVNVSDYTEGVPLNTIKLVTVAVSWPGNGRQRAGSYSVSTLITRSQYP